MKIQAYTYSWWVRAGKNSLCANYGECIFKTRHVVRPNKPLIWGNMDMKKKHIVKQHHSRLCTPFTFNQISGAFQKKHIPQTYLSGSHAGAALCSASIKCIASAVVMGLTPTNGTVMGKIGVNSEVAWGDIAATFNLEAGKILCGHAWATYTPGKIINI